MKNIFLYLVLIVAFFNTSYAENAPVSTSQVKVQETKEEIEAKKQASIASIKEQIQNIDDELKDNIWIKRYENYLTYRRLENELKKIKEDADKYAKWRGDKYKELSYQLNNKVKIKENELELISEYKDSPIGAQIKPQSITKAPDVTNPFVIIEGFSYIKRLEESQTLYRDSNKQLTQLLVTLTTKLDLLKKLYKLDPVLKINLEINQLNQWVKDFNMVVEIVSTTYDVYAKKIDQVKQEVNNQISDEIRNILKLVIIISILFGISVIARIGTKKYVEDDDKHYTTNKLITFTFIIVSLLVIIFSYIDNASYLVTFLGFASAGIAIALKDWFMSIFGWVAIMTSGSIHVGDRVKVTRDGTQVVGDVLDITLLKISVREDVTLTSYQTNKRTGRVFFIPNNYIFTDMIANYTYDGLRTVWDVVEIHITFDSNHKRAVELAKSIAIANAKPYTELARKRLQKMRTKYVLRNSNPEPRVFAFVEPYGININTWFHTNSHSTLGLRSTMSMEILEAFKAADDITIAYPTQTLRVAQSTQASAEDLLPGVNSAHGLFDGPNVQ